MPGEAAIHPDQEAFAKEIAHQLHEGQFSELAQLFAQPQNVRALATSRVQFLTMLIPTVQPIEVLAKSVDRARVFVLNSGPDTVHLGHDYGVRATSIDRFPLPTAVGFVIASRTPLWAIGTSATSQLSLMVEQWDAA